MFSKVAQAIIKDLQEGHYANYAKLLASYLRRLGCAVYCSILRYLTFKDIFLHCIMYLNKAYPYPYFIILTGTDYFYVTKRKTETQKDEVIQGHIVLVESEVAI
jgi:hypothetical protein